MTVAPSGYVMEWCPTHPKATLGVYFQHRLVMECELGRFLLPGEVVHHRNHVRHDNALGNLRLSASHAVHMREHWAGRGRNDPELIERVRKAAADPTIGLEAMGVSPGTVQAICREHGFRWIPCGQRGTARLLTDGSVRAALQGRTTIDAAAHLGVSAQILYNRFDHLLRKRPSPGALDPHRKQVLDMAFRQRMTKAAIGARFGVSDVCVIRSIQRWSRQDAKRGEPALPAIPRNRPGPKPGRKARDTAARPPAQA
jgi:hypothetical protein